MAATRLRAAAFVTVVGLAMCVPALPASAQVVEPGVPVGACSPATVGSPIQSTGGTENQICQGGGLVFVAPAVGQVATVVGPTIIGPSQNGTIFVSPGNVIAG